MKISISIGKMHVAYLILTLAILTGINYAIAQTASPDPGHPADQIGPGTIAGTLTVTSGGKIGIGMTNPEYTLDVNGEIRGNNIGTLSGSNNAYLDSNGNIYASGSACSEGGANCLSEIDGVAVYNCPDKHGYTCSYVIGTCGGGGLRLASELDSQHRCWYYYTASGGTCASRVKYASCTYVGRLVKT